MKHMEMLLKKYHRAPLLLLAGAVLLAVPTLAQEERREAPQRTAPTAAARQGGEAAAQKPIPPEKSSVTKHEISLNGQTLRYTATAGTLLIRDDQEEPNASVFYVAYTLDGVADPTSRPVTFLYNGGPGSASMWLHMGSVGPMRVVTASPEATGPGPYKLVPNEYSTLDKTDLVFVDAVGTGYSRPVGKGTERDFTGVDQDVRSFARFITRYITVNQRWNSPKYLMGESYGTTRSAALVDALDSGGIACNGVILVSSILNFGVRQPGMDHIYVGNLPTYAAIAWQHDKLTKKPADLKKFLDEVRAFARGPYAEALAQGQNLPAAQVDSIAAKVSAYTGLSVKYVKEANLRIDPSRFRKELLRDERLIIGRYDGRFEGTDVDAAGENPGFDPSSTGITGAYVTMLNDYLSRELKYTSQETYRPSAGAAIQNWDWRHRVGGGGGGGAFAGGRQQLQPWVGADLADAIRKNPRLKVLSVNGYFDLATPFFLTEYDLAHMDLEPKLRKNVEFTYYMSGHMIYLNVDALKQMKSDLAAFYDSTLK
jgi:carboxypeptidase C (cathepsin A)